MIDKESIELAKGFLKGLTPEPRLTVSEWSDLHRYLAPTSSAEPGKWKTDRTPYLRPIMDALSATSPIQEVVFIKGAQIGATEMGFNWIGYIIDVAPAPTLMVQPTEAMAKRNSKMRFDPMVEATDRLKDKIKPARSRDADNTTLQKGFPGGVLVMSGANSASGLRSMPVRNLMLDEVDAYPLDLEGEGSPVDLARARTRTFAKRKTFILSTPTVEHTSVIYKEFLTTDQNYLHVPCPYCNTFQALKWDNLKWEPGNPDSVLYYCEGCGVGIEERHKSYMLPRGVMVPANPQAVSSTKIGFHVSSLYSPLGWYSWKDAAKDWEDAEGNVTKQKTFINTVLGLTWKESGEAPAWENLYNRRELYAQNKPCNEVMFITVGVDVQKDRIELEVVGWCRKKRTYSIDFRVLIGDTSKEEVWNELAEVVGETWEREDGNILPMKLMAVDTGYNTQFVYAFCQRFDATRVIPVKGQQKQQTIVSPPKQVNITKAGKKAGKTKVWNVGVDMLKSELYGFLRNEIKEDGTIPLGYCHFPQYDQHYFKGLTGEQLELRKNTKGYNEYVWVKKYERNEPLDCRVYARAAAYVVGIDRFDDSEKWWNSLVRERVPNSTSTPKKKKRRDSGDGFW